MDRLHKIGFSKLTSVEKALEKMFSIVKIRPSIKVDTINSLNYTIADDIKSNIAVPHFDRSAMDGYAVIAKDTFGASLINPKYIKEAGKIEIGEVSNITLNNSEAVRISTGAQIPNGADAVIKIEDTEIDHSTIKIYNSIVPGRNISKKGEDTKKGEVIIEKGTQLKPEHIALLCSQGIDKTIVREPPKVSIFATGDELVEVGNILENNQIYNSNSPMISNLVKLYGGDVIKVETVKDNKDLIQTKLLESLSLSDIIIFSGGTSVGTKDYLPEIIKENATIIIHGIAMRPGSPILIAHKDDILIFCLPGTPVAAYLGFLKFVGPAIRKLLGSKRLDLRENCLAIINDDVPVSSIGYIHYLRVKIKKEENKFIAHPIRLKGSGMISSLTNSDGIVEISPSQEGLKKGDKVSIKLHPK